MSTNDPLTNQFKCITQNEQTKLWSKQQKKRLKRQKKKQRKQNYNTNNSQNINNTNNKSSNSSQTRSTFLYGTNSNGDENTKDSTESTHPYTEMIEPTEQTQTKNVKNVKNVKNRKNRNKGPGFKTYVKSSNQEQLNTISAQMLRAKLLGNNNLYRELETKLNALREDSFLIEHRYLTKTPSNKKKINRNELNDETVKGNGKGKKTELIMDSEISKKLHDMSDTMDEHDNINTLLRKERNHTTIYDHKNISNIMNSNLNSDEQFDLISSNSLKRKRRKTSNIEKERSVKRARLISQHKHKTNWLHSCKYCIENEEIHNSDVTYSVIYYGEYMYVAIPKQECLVSYQCMIIPNMHIKSYREGILNNIEIGSTKEQQLQFEKELYAIQKMLCKIFKKKCDCGAVFIETVRNLKKNYHSIIHCYPIPFEQYNLCPIYFKKAIVESDVVWSTNKKLIEITKQKSLHKSIPHFMSYFYVQFGLFDGYVHIIEDETKIKQDFGPQTIAGIVGKVLFKVKNESYQKHIQRINQFKLLFEPFKQKLDKKLDKKLNKTDNKNKR